MVQTPIYTEIKTSSNNQIDLKDLRLSSNGHNISSDDLGWLQSFSHDTPDSVLKAFYAENGYVFIKKLLPAEVVREMRHKYFEFVSPSGVLKVGTDPVDGIYCGAPPSHFGGPGTAATAHGDMDLKAADFLKLATDAHRAQFYKEFQKHPALAGFVKRLMGWDRTLLLQRQMLRTNVPGAECTAVHYDHIFLRGGPPTFLTAWIPIGHVTPESGALIYLEKSHVLGAEIEQTFTDNAKHMSTNDRISAFNTNMMRGGVLGTDAEDFGRVHGRKWLIANFDDGDVIFHHPFMIHASACNQSPADRIRLATDLRYVNLDEAFDRRWMQYWAPSDGL